MIETMLTTEDNPFDPFTQWREWYAYDAQLGHHTPALLARVAVLSNDLSEADQSLAIDEAIEEIVRENVSGVHVAVTREVDSGENEGIDEET